MAANELDLSYSEIRDVAANAVLWPTPANWNSKHSNVFGNAVKRGSRRFYYQATIPGETTPHTWSFLEPWARLRTTPDYSTGTIDADGDPNVVTLAGGEWPSWAADGDLWITHDTSGTAITERVEVVTRDSDAELTVGSTSEPAAINASSSNISSWSLKRHYYDLPDDYAGMASDAMTLRRDSRESGEIQIVSEQFIREHDRDETTGVPRLAAVVPVTATSSEPTRWKVTFYPFPKETYEIEYRYHAIPPLLDSSTDVYAWGGVPHAEALLESIVSQLMIMVRDDYTREETYMAALISAVKHDRKVNSKHTLGYGSESVGRPDYRNPQTLRDYLRYKGRGVPYANITWS